MLLAFAVAPTTTPSAEGAVTSAVARAVKIVRESGLPYETTSMFTTIEGEWDEVMSAVAEVSPRVSLVMKADIRAGRSDEMHGKLERLENAIAELD